MRGHNSVLRTRSCHPDHFLRSKIGGNKSEACDPERNRAPAHQKVRAIFYFPFEGGADSNDEYEIKNDRDVIDEYKLHSAPFSFFLSKINRFPEVLTAFSAMKSKMGPVMN